MADTDNPPPDIAESDRIVRAWSATAKPGDLPPLEVHAHALKIHNHLRTHGASQPPRVQSAIDRFKLMPRSDSPPVMPAWKDPRPEVQRWRLR
jgi:hypothetical protein